MPEPGQVIGRMSVEQLVCQEAKNTSQGDSSEFRKHTEGTPVGHGQTTRASR